MELFVLFIIIFVGGVVCCFIIDALKGLFGIKDVDAMYNDGLITLNEARKKKGLSPLPDGDKVKGSE